MLAIYVMLDILYVDFFLRISRKYIMLAFRFFAVVASLAAMISCFIVVQGQAAREEELQSRVQRRYSRQTRTYLFLFINFFYY